MVLIGVIADTHIPDRAKSINPKALEIFIENQVDLIVHAGDLCNMSVIRELEKIAPVHAVLGNRDILLRPPLPITIELAIEEINITITHGHFGWLGYFLEKLSYLIHGPRKFIYLENQLIKRFPDSDLIIFGHHHAPTNKTVEGKILFNPGSSCCPNPFIKNLKPSIGLIHIEGKITNSEIIYLE